MFKQDGRTSGQGAVVTGPLDEVVAELDGVETAASADEVERAASADEVLTKVLVLVIST